jgi:putative endonuclease
VTRRFAGSRSASATGAQAERAARRFLGARGLTTVAANYRCRLGELDLVMTDGATLVIIEVRYRERPNPVDPALTVTIRKRRRMLQATAYFLQHNRRFRDWSVRLDVLGVSGSLEAPGIRWIRNAFTGDDMV